MLRRITNSRFVELKKTKGYTLLISGNETARRHTNFRSESGSQCDMWPGIRHRVGWALQQGQKNRLRNLRDVAVHCQTAVDMYQRRRPVIKHYATPNHDAHCRTGLTQGEIVGS
ncbi:hypothetical protein TNCV_3030331 [Trichonephila clavipes]|nr:hypothetical protein TNCV_3030331 [Trichonephila clavipes]